MEFPTSIRVYEDQCEAVTSWLAADKWLTQHEFDKLSFDWKHDRTRKQRIHSFNDETIVLPLWGDPNLAILQEMQRAGMVEAKTEEGVVSYRLANVEVG